MCLNIRYRTSILENQWNSFKQLEMWTDSVTDLNFNINLLNFDFSLFLHISAGETTVWEYECVDTCVVTLIKCRTFYFFFFFVFIKVEKPAVSHSQHVKYSRAAWSVALSPKVCCFRCGLGECWCCLVSDSHLLKGKVAQG